MSAEFITSRLTSKSQTVIPLAIRRRLGLKPGDLIRYHARGKKIEIEKITDDADESSFDPFSAFTEWASPEDDEDFAHL